MNINSIRNQTLSFYMRKIQLLGTESLAIRDMNTYYYHICTIDAAYYRVKIYICSGLLSIRVVSD